MMAARTPRLLHRLLRASPAPLTTGAVRAYYGRDIPPSCIGALPVLLGGMSTIRS